MSKDNKLTDGKNLIWEGSRMMLPEHVIGINEHRKTLLRKKLPELDEQELQELDRRIGEAKQTGATIALSIWGEYEDREVTGIIQKVENGQVRIRTIEGFESISYLLITNVYRSGD